MYKLFFTVLLVFSVTLSAFSQGKIGSPYSRYGLGDVNSSPLIRNNAMGGLSYTLPYKGNVNYINPAGVAGIDTLTFIFDFGLVGGVRAYSINNPKLSQTKSDYQVAYMNFGFSLNKWWKMALSIAPYSSVGYNISSSDSSLNVKRNYIIDGSGGLTKLSFSNAFSPINNLRVGVNTSLLFGEIFQNSSIIFKEDPNSGFMDLIVQNKIRVSDFNFDIGVQYDMDINPKHKLTFGAVYNHNSDLRAYKTGVMYNKSSSASIRDTLSVFNEKKGSVTLPLSLGLGIGYCFDEKLYIGLDYTLQSWKNAKFFNDIDSLKNSNFVSLGMEYIPSGYKTSNYKYWENVSYRFGAYYGGTSFKFKTDQQPINDFGISFGVGLPLKRSKTSFDISIKLGQRGTHSDNLIKERYAVVGVGFNLADIWFVKSKFD